MNKWASRYLFSTEGHLFPISKKFRRKVWEEDIVEVHENEDIAPSTVVVARTNASFSNVSFMY